MATIVVTNSNATGAGSLASAIAQAESTGAADTIVFAAGVTHAYPTSTLLITTTITIDGDRDNDGIADVSISADPQEAGLGVHSLFRVDPTGVLKLDGVVLRDGYGQATTSTPAAGAVLNFGVVNAVNSDFLSNTAVGYHGRDGFGGGDGENGGAAAGAIYNAGTLTLSNGRFFANVGAGGGGGIGGAGLLGGSFGGDGGDGGTGGDAASAIINAAGATMTLSLVTFDGGSAYTGWGGGGGNGGGGTLSGGDGGDGGDSGRAGGYFLNFGKASGTFIAAADGFVGVGNYGAGGQGGHGAFDGQQGFEGDHGRGTGTKGVTVATAGNETVIGLSGPENIFGLDGADRLEGRGGNDRLHGGAGNDIIDGGVGNDELYPGEGDDIVLVSTGEDLVSIDTRGSGSGTDTIDFGALTKGVTIDLGVTSSQTFFGGSITLSYQLFENINGTDFGDTLAGEGRANRMDGGAGADTLEGRGGDDVYIVDNAGDVVIEAAGGGIADRVMARASYVLAAGADIELLTTVSSGASTAINLSGNSLHQDITGNAGRNTLKDGVGAADALRGLGGNDTYLVYAAGTTIAEGSTGGADRALAAVDFTLGAGQYVEALSTTKAAGTASIDLTGNALHQTITGNAGVNVLSDGGVGKADTMSGLSGNDTYRVYNSGDVIIEGSTQGAADRVMAAVGYTLGAGAHVENLTTNGSNGKSGIDLTGNALAQTIIGNAGDNRLEGREGNDTLRGLGGGDTFVFNTQLGASNVDTVADFKVADDRFLLSDVIFTTLNTGILASGYFRNNTTGLAQDANDHIIYERDTGELYYDSNGNAAGGSVLFAKIAVGLSLTNADFSVA